MAKVKIGIIHEGKTPVDHRVALTPKQAAMVRELYPNVELVVQSSNVRCFSDQDYRDQGIEVVASLNDCDIIFGVKEVPIPDLLDNKTYFFFSHTIKKQPYNRSLLQEVLHKNIRLIDYETLTDESGARIIAFGRWAGIVGAYNGIWTYGKKHGLFKLRRAHECHDLNDLKSEFSKVNLPPIKIALTGGGRVAQGAMEVLAGMGIRQVSTKDFLSQEFREPVFTQLNDADYNARKDGSAFDLNHYFQNPSEYTGTFLPFARKADLLIAAAFWHPQAPVLFTREEMLHDDFQINVVADITCDIEGSIPSTLRASTIAEPLYDYDPEMHCEKEALSDEKNVTVMAVDNLPCELPRDASESFGDQLIKNVLPSLLGQDNGGIIQRATIADKGSLTEKYIYLQDYVDGH